MSRSAAPAPADAVGGRRSASRLAAVQALYQIEFGGGRPEAVITEFIDCHLGAEIDGDRYTEADTDFFRVLVRGGTGRMEELDQLLDECMGPIRTVERLDGILRAVLRASAFELLVRKDVPTRVVLNEYMNVAHAFFSGTEPKLVNGVLDKLAHRLRPRDL